ncbi:MAG TPA: penicillin-binding protein 1A [Steroidobacteraceae bacterium]|nr:penicillin-binding protein 1A [Steroidobacteraceae bacterium]
MNQRYLRTGFSVLAIVLVITAAIGYAGLCSYVYLAPAIPDVGTLRDVRLQVPLRVFSRDGRLIAQIGEYRRIPVSYEAIPLRVRQAFLAAEDDRFFKHHGVDYAGLLRATMVNLVSGAPSQGGGTITMQLARNMFLTPERRFDRKLKEIFLSFRIESEFTKPEILTLYLNKIFLGQRAYGAAAAAEVYFGKSLDQLTLGETATIAGMPRAPSRDNPVANPERAKLRRLYVLRRMQELGEIDQSEYDAATSAPMESQLHGPIAEVEAPYIAEMARADMFARLGDDTYTAGYRVFTTIDSRLQQAANSALRLGLIEYDRRHGYRGPIAKVPIRPGETPAEMLTALEDQATINVLQPALVVDVAERAARVLLKDGRSMQIDWPGIAWARAATDGGVGPEPKKASDVLAPGDIIYVIRTGNTAQLAQLPAAQGALVAEDPRDAAIVALDGGFDFFVSKFNRVTQARRQPGSAFKPFIYSAALENGFTPSSIVMDAPVVFEDEAAEDTWRPENSTGEFYGPTRLREALVRSRNLVSVRLMRAMGIPYTMNYLQRFGFERADLPDDLTLALGSLQLTPAELAAGFATFANGGFHVRPYYLERIEDASGKVLFQAKPVIACADCDADATALRIPQGGSASALEAADAVRGGRGHLPTAQVAQRSISAQNAYLITDMMRDVIKRGTGRRAAALGRDDLAGKTGTTNDHHDAWFCGFNPRLVAAVWVGFDQEASLGAGEEGGRTAVPVWVHFMRQALRDTPEIRMPAPDGLVTVKISPQTGLLASADDPNAIFETFMEGHLPENSDPFARGQQASREQTTEEPLF